MGVRKRFDGTNWVPEVGDPESYVAQHAAQDFLHITNLEANHFTQSEPITSYPLGVSTFIVNGNNPDWVYGYGSVQTTYLTVHRAFQWFYPHNATAAWYRVWTGGETGSWNIWDFIEEGGGGEEGKRSGKDDLGVFTTVEWFRGDGTRYKRSVVSGGESPNYTTRGVWWYAANGTTVLLAETFDLIYDADGDLVEQRLA